MIQSIITDNLIANYRNTHYQIGTGSDTISLRIDQYSQLLAKLLATSQHSCAAIVTADNPHSQCVNEEENLAQHERLRSLLQRCAYPVIESLHIDPTGQWPNEKSFFILGLTLNTARSLGQQFNQNAIVWAGDDAIPRLILLR